MPCVMFVDLASAFTIVVPEWLHRRLLQLLECGALHLPVDYWLPIRQFVQLGPYHSVSTDIHQHSWPCTLTSHLLECMSSNHSIVLIKFAEVTTLIGPIRDNDKPAYRREEACLASGCIDNNLELITQETLLMVSDKNLPLHLPLEINTHAVSEVDLFKFIGTNMSENIKQEIHTTTIIK